jgi:hypothetical protein
MLTPFIIGAGVSVARSQGGSGWALLLALIAALALFLARQPLTLWIRVWRGKTRRSDEAAARFWALLLLGIAAWCGLGLLLLGRWSILWLAVPASAVLGATLALGAMLGPRQLLTELVGVVGLSLAAPAAYAAYLGDLPALAWVVWALCAAHDVISVLFVRLRIDQKHARATRRDGMITVLAHVAALGLITGFIVLGWLPPLVAAPLAALLLRAAIVAWRNPPLENVRRFGFIEMGVSLAFALIVIAAFVIEPSGSGALLAQGLCYQYT